MVENRKNEHNYSVLDFGISLGTKFRLEQTILNSGTKFSQKGFIRRKTEKVNSTINSTYSN